MRTPVHVGIIMDGNGRWAEERGLGRSAGHRAGVEALRRAVRAAGEAGIRYLTVYAFSSENWSRPVHEVNDLLGLFRLFVHRDLQKLAANGVRVRMIGERDSLEPDLRELVRHAEELTKDNDRLLLQIAFNYGSRNEMARACRALAQRASHGLIDPRTIDEAMIAEALDTGGIPDPDLIIRTSGEQRLSNFLLWQAAYAEFVFLPTLWPDFDQEQLQRALTIYANRDRRYGGVNTQTAAS